MVAATSTAVMTAAAPSMDDARRAADVIVEAAGGDVKVFVYGSVARGDAHEGSDIDLYAVFADLDYAKRHEVAWGLKDTLAEIANGYRFDLHVTDVPEWEGRRKVPNTFESGIAKDAVLVGGEVCEASVNWEKEQVKPMTVRGEAQRFLDEVLWDQLRDVRQQTAPRGDDESPPMGAPLFGATAEEEDEERQAQELAEQSRLRRMKKLVAEAALAIELALKAAVVLQGAPRQSGKAVGHNILAGIKAVAEPLRSELEALVVGHGLDPEKISEWREAATYDAEERRRATADEQLYDYLDTALDVAARVVDEYAREGASTERAVPVIADIAEARNKGHLRRADQFNPEANTPWEPAYKHIP